MNYMREKTSAIVLKNIIYTAVFASIICVTTMAVKIPAVGGYYHVGDAFIYFAAVCMPLPYAMIAGALGGAFSDLLLGYAVYALPTLIIKACIAGFFSNKEPKILCVRNFIAMLIASVITIGGYYIAEVIILSGNFAGALVTVYGNAIQSVSSAVVFVIIAVVADRTNIRSVIFR